MKLIDLLDQMKIENPMEWITADHYERTLRRYDEFLITTNSVTVPATLEALTTQHVNGFLVWLKKRENAQQVADDTWQAWYECDMGNQRYGAEVSVGEQLAGTRSILE